MNDVSLSLEGLLGLVILGFVIAVNVFYWVSMWKVYAKAGEPGWAIFVPFYNTWVLWRISGRNGVGSLGWYALMLVGSAAAIFAVASQMATIFTVGSGSDWKVFAGYGVFALLMLAAIVWYCRVLIDIGRAFRMSGVMSFLLLVVFPFVGWPYLAFGPFGFDDRFAQAAWRAGEGPPVGFSENAPPWYS